MNSDEANELSQAHSQAFKDLREDISDFKDTFDVFASFQEQTVNAEINRLQGEINKLEIEIKQ